MATNQNQTGLTVEETSASQTVVEHYEEWIGGHCIRCVQLADHTFMTLAAYLTERGLTLRQYLAERGLVS